ncbi:MAG: flagellar motor protein MotB [Marinilabiliales bacterium]|nr:MAG: flagellar motor protein MotB [Marinilabiliales bacterium]
MGNYKSIFVFTVIMLAASCVPAKHFQEMRDEKVRSEQERDSLLIENKRMDVALTEMEARILVLNNEIEQLILDSTDRALILRNTRAELERTRRQYNELQETQEAVLKGSARETTRLLQQLQTTQEDLMAREDRLKEIEKDLTEKEQALGTLKADLDRRNERLMELEDVLARQDSVVNALHNTISAALRGFEGQGLSVHEKNGKVYVSLEEQLLFQTGSTVVDTEGERALRDLAEVLEENPEINIMIEGHTDNVPVIPGPRMRDNWDLSVLRATSIVRILLDGTGIDPTRLLVAGRGEYMPLEQGDTPEARRINRRTEIILTPQLDELFRIIQPN